MGLSGSLREFHLSEIIQLLSSQKKTGCLTLNQKSEEAYLHFEEGRLVAVRDPGLKSNDPLMRFLKRVHWLSPEQLHGIETLHTESGRDLLDILLNGRYLDSEELTILYERMSIDHVFQLLGWEEATYNFNSTSPIKTCLPLSFATDGLLMEAVRRIDESRRYLQELPEAHEIPGLKELPDPDASLSEEEKEIFALVDSNRTIAEVVAEAPLCDFEALEALSSLFENDWLEIVGSREVGGVRVASKPDPKPASRKAEIAMTAILSVIVLGLLLLTAPLRQAPHAVLENPEQDVYQRARWDDVTIALEVYRAETGSYPADLDELVSSEWLVRSQLQFPGHAIEYRLDPGGRSYSLEAQSLTPDS